MNAAVERLTALLAVQPATLGEYDAQPSNESHVRAFGGQLIGQAVTALTRELDDRPLHSFHGYFLRPAAVDQPLSYRVTALRQGRSFTHQRVEAHQGEQVVFTAMASHHGGEDGAAHSVPLPDVPPPDDCEPFEVRYDGRRSDDDMGRWFDRCDPFDIRPVGPTAFDIVDDDRPSSAFWVRTRSTIDRPDCPSAALHAAVVGYLSDLAVLDPILMTHGVRWTDAPIIGASLDHAIWFHRPFDVSEWLLFRHESPTSASGRGLATGTVWNTDGEVVASIAQEALLRPTGRRP